MGKESVQGSQEQHVFLIYSPQQRYVTGDSVARAVSNRLSVPLKTFFFSHFPSVSMILYFSQLSYEKERWFESIRQSAQQARTLRRV